MTITIDFIRWRAACLPSAATQSDRKQAPNGRRQWRDDCSTVRQSRCETPHTSRSFCIFVIADDEHSPALGRGSVLSSFSQRACAGSLTMSCVFFHSAAASHSVILAAERRKISQKKEKEKRKGCSVRHTLLEVSPGGAVCNTHACGLMM